MQMHTTSFWLTLPERLIAEQDAPRSLVIDALRGLGAALETVATLTLMCDPRDIGQSLGDGGSEGSSAPLPAGRDPFARRTGGFDPTIFLFDAHAGGVGLAPRIYERATELVARARSLIQRCPCRGGCPACVGPAEEDGQRKRMALLLLESLALPPSDEHFEVGAVPASAVGP
jgi:DEAD/DEAH box helicase domain-containing protein